MILRYIYVWVLLFPIYKDKEGGGPMKGFNYGIFSYFSNNFIFDKRRPTLDQKITPINLDGCLLKP